MYFISLVVENVTLSVDNNEDLLYCLKVRINEAEVPFFFIFIDLMFLHRPHILSPYIMSVCISNSLVGIRLFVCRTFRGLIYFVFIIHIFIT